MPDCATNRATKNDASGFSAALVPPIKISLHSSHPRIARLWRQPLVQPLYSASVTHNMEWGILALFLGTLKNGSLGGVSAG